jgi:hypothetical protein
MEKMPKKRSNTITKWMEVRDLEIHPVAQRRLVQSRLDKLKKEMDLDAIGTIKAVQYAINGKMAVWVIDGQHRVRALMELGFGEWMVEVQINLDATTDEQACDLFLKFDDYSPVAPFDKFMVELRSGVESAVGVEEIAKRYGLKIEPHTADACMCCVSVLKRVWNLDKGRTLLTTLGVITEAWGKRATALEGRVIDGTALLIHRYRKSLDLAALILVLSKYSGGPSGLIGDAGGIKELYKGSVAKCVAQAEVNHYNQRRRVGRLGSL